VTNDSDGQASRHSQAPALHPDHDAVASEVRGWFTTSAPEIGYEVASHWYGDLSEIGDRRARLILSVDKPADVPAGLTAARAAHPGADLTIWVDDRARAARLDGALRAAGAVPRDATTHLALVGAMAEVAGPDALLIREVADSDLDRWAAVKVQSFADTEDPPAADQVAAEASERLGERSLTDLRIATLDGDEVAVFACYTGADQLVFTLGTRVPYRHRGIAQAMLAEWVARAHTAGCRSMMINAHQGGRPEALYRRLGFVDEIYWYQAYELAAATSSAGVVPTP
jgi:GNAT superfamily N-acetyltransferase